MYLYIFFSVATLVSLHMIDLLLYLLFMDVPRARLLWGLTIFIVSISSVSLGSSYKDDKWFGWLEP